MANTAGIIDIKLRAGFDKGAMNQATREVGRNMQLMSNRVGKAGSAFSQAIGTSIAPFGAAMVGAFALGGMAAVRFEEQFANVKKTLDIKQEGKEAEAAFANIALQLRSLAKFSPAGINELTQIAAVGGQLGIAASDIVKFTDTIQKLTVATNMSAEDAAMSLARLQKITGLAASEVDNLASVIVKLGNNFATTESEIVTAATQIATATAGIASDFNNAATDAVAFATALRAVGQPAQAGATAIIRLVQVVDRLTSVGGKRLQLVAQTAGMTVEAFKGLFEIDPGQALASFIEGLGEVEDRGDDAVAILEEIGLGQIRTRRAIQALSRAEGADGGGLLSEALAMSNQEFKENNALLTEAERRYETVASQVKILKNIVNESAISFGEQFLPSINNAVQGLANFLTFLTDFDKRVKGIGRIGTVFTVIGGSIFGLRAAFKTMAQGTLEAEAAISRLTMGVSSLNAEQERLLFKNQRGMGGMFFTGGLSQSLGDTFARDKSKKAFTPGSFLSRFGTQTTQVQGKHFEETQRTVTQTTTLFQRGIGTIQGGTKEAFRALKQLSGGGKIATFRFLKLNKAFSDSDMFLRNMDNAIMKFNKTGKGTIVLTERMKGGMLGLSIAARTATAAVIGFAKSIGIMLIATAAISGIFSIFERIGARKRSMDEFANGLDGITESILELESHKLTLEELLDLKELKKNEGAPKEVTDAIDEMIASTEKAISRNEAQARGDAGGLLQTLLYGQKGGKGLEKDIEKFAEDAGLDATNLESKIFGGLSGLVTDIQSGGLPTVDSVLEELISGGTGDRAVDKQIERISQAGELLPLMQDLNKVRSKSQKNTILQNLGLNIPDSDLKNVVNTLGLYTEVIEQTTGANLGQMVSGQEVEQSSKLLEAKGQFLNRQQELLVTQGLMQENQTLDATKQENFAKASGMVMDIIREKAKEAGGTVDSLEESIEGMELAFGDIAKTIDDNFESAINRAISTLDKLPEAARMTAQKFIENLEHNLEMTDVFNKLISQIALQSPLVAKQLSEIGPSALRVAQDFVNMPGLAAGLESRLMESVGPELAEAASKMLKDNASEFEQASEGLADGFIVGIFNKQDEIAEVFSESVEQAIEKVMEDNDIKSPSDKTRKLIGHPLIQGVIEGIKDGQQNLERVFVEALKSAVTQAQEDFSLITDFRTAQRGVASAAAARIKAEQQLNQERRNNATLTERIIKNQKELNKLEIEGAKGNITLNEEINILRKKISLEDKLKNAGGNKSAKELLAIQKAEENIQDLRAMANKGVISNLELQAAEEDLARMKGTDLSDDERKLAILELAQAEKDLNKIKEDALETDPQLISLREEDIKLRDELELSSLNLTMAIDGVTRAKENEVNADLRLLDSTAKLEDTIANDGEYLTRLGNLNNVYGDTTDSIQGIINGTDQLVANLISQTPAIEEHMNRIKASLLDINFIEQLNEEQAILDARLGKGKGSNVLDTPGQNPDLPISKGGVGFFSPGDELNIPGGGSSFGNVFRSFMDFLTRMAARFDGNFIPGMGMGGRVSSYRYGGRGDPMTRALVGEYGPEEVRFVPGSGFLVKPLGTGKSGTVVNNLNVNVTGVPSDPISARKAAVQISKALRKLDKEGSAGTGLRRN